MRVLGIDSATWTASVGIVDAGAVLAERSLAVSDSHATLLLALIEETLDAAGLGVCDLDLLAISIGPGSFTGLRIGLSVVKGLAIATGTVAIGVPTIEALALATGPRAGLVCPVLDARRGEVYTATFRWGGDGLRCVSGLVAVTPAQLAARLVPPCTLIGDGVDAYATVWRQLLAEGAELVPSSLLSPRGAVVAQLGVARFETQGADDVGRLEPSYVRKSDAEMERAARS